MTSEKVAKLELGIFPIDTRTVLTIETGIDWVLKHTTLEFDKENEDDLKALPPCVKLFLLDFCDIQDLGIGVASESIEGLSQSFNGDKDTLLWQSAERLLDGYLKPRIRFVSAQKKWN